MHFNDILFLKCGGKKGHKEQGLTWKKEKRPFCQRQEGKDGEGAEGRHRQSARSRMDEVIDQRQELCQRKRVWEGIERSVQQPGDSCHPGMRKVLQGTTAAWVAWELLQSSPFPNGRWQVEVFCLCTSLLSAIGNVYIFCTEREITWLLISVMTYLPWRKGGKLTSDRETREIPVFPHQGRKMS